MRGAQSGPLAQHDPDHAMRQWHQDPEAHQKEADFAQIAETPGGDHAHFQEEQREYALEGRHEKSRRGVQAPLAAQKAHQQRTHQQKHTPSQQTFVQGQSEH